MNEPELKEDFLNILRVLSSGVRLTQRIISKASGFSLGKTNYLIKELSKKGIIEAKSFSSKDGKLKKVQYVLTKKGLKEKLRLTLYFLDRKEKEYRQLEKEAEEMKTAGCKLEAADFRL